MNSISSITASPLQKSMKINNLAFDASQSTSSTSEVVATSKEATISTTWGFKVDENGYFGSDFNAAAGIPSHVKINQKTLESVAKSMQVMGSSQDPISALSKAWSNFSKIAGTSLDSDGSMSLEQIHNMPVSYVTDSSIFGNIVSVQQTQRESSKIYEAFNAVNTLSDGNFYQGISSFMGYYSSYGNNSDGSSFDTISFLKDSLRDMGITADEGNTNEISVGNLFNYFVGNNAPRNETDMIYVKAAQAYQDFTKSGQSIEDYAKSNFGDDFFNEAMKGYGMTSDKKFSQALVDQLLKEVNEQIEKDREAFKKITQDNAHQEQSTNPTNTTAKSYLSLTDPTLQSGSLLSIGS